MLTFDVECESCIARLAGLVPGLTLHRALVLFTTHFFHHLRVRLKGQCHEIFCFWFFSWVSFPPAQEYPIRTVSNFSKTRGDIRGARCTTGINDTCGKFATGVNDNIKGKVT